MGIFGDTAPMIIIGLFTTIATFVLHLVGYATPYWWKYENSNLGLWQTCQDDVCLSISDLPSAEYPDQYKAAQALETIAFVAYLAAVVSAVLKVCVMKNNGMVYVMTAMANFIGALFGLIGLILFATMSLGGEKLDSSKLHFSFAFCVVASFGGIVSGVLFILAWRWVHLKQ